jgi:hypothetical protein
LYASEHLSGRFHPSAASSANVDNHAMNNAGPQPYARIEAIGTADTCDTIIQHIRRRHDIATGIAIYADSVNFTRPPAVDI